MTTISWPARFSTASWTVPLPESTGFEKGATGRGTVIGLGPGANASRRTLLRRLWNVHTVMRRFVPLLTAFLIGLPLAHGLPGLSLIDEVSVEDAPGDATINGVPSDDLDLLAARLAIEEESLVAELTIADLQTALEKGQGDDQTRPWFWSRIHFDSAAFHVVWEIDSHRSNSGAFVDDTLVALYREDESGWTLLYEAPAENRLDDNVLSATLPMSALTTPENFSPGPGSTIQVESATSYYDPGQDPHGTGSYGIIFRQTQGTITGADDVAFPDGSIVELPGDEAGILGLSTVQPIRFSNGEATTYHWPVAVTNNDEARIEAVLSVDADEELVVSAPELVSLSPGERRVVDVFATAPFQHRHGGERNIDIHVEGGGVESTLALRIQYLEVPQPSGHHQQAYLHGFNGGSSPPRYWMDTIQEPEAPTSVHSAFASFQCRSGADQEDGRGLAFPLEPALKLGVDADLGRTAHFTGTFYTQSARPAGEFVAELVAYKIVDGQPSKLLATDHGATTMPLAASGAEDVPIDLALRVPEVFDYLESGSGYNMAMLVGFCAGMPIGSDFGPQVVDQLADSRMAISDGAISLPFHDFHEAISIPASSSLKLSVADAVASAAPGATILWEATTESETAEALTIRTLGLHGDEATVHGSSFHAGDTIPVSFIVPNGRGERFEIIIQVQGQSTGDTAAIRLIVDVDSASTRNDADLVDAFAPEVESSGVGFVGFVIIVGLALRRGHDPGRGAK